MEEQHVPTHFFGGLAFVCALGFLFFFMHLGSAWLNRLNLCELGLNATVTTTARTEERPEFYAPKVIPVSDRERFEGFGCREDVAPCAMEDEAKEGINEGASKSEIEEMDDKVSDFNDKDYDNGEDEHADDDEVSASSDVDDDAGEDDENGSALNDEEDGTAKDDDEVSALSDEEDDTGADDNEVSASNDDTVKNENEDDEASAFNLEDEKEDDEVSASNVEEEEDDEESASNLEDEEEDDEVSASNVEDEDEDDDKVNASNGEDEDEDEDDEVSASNGEDEDEDDEVSDFSDEDDDYDDEEYYDEDDNDDDGWEVLERRQFRRDYELAVRFVESLQNDEGLPQLSEHEKLRLYGLHKIAVEGPCQEPPPAPFNLTARSKWNAWKRLGFMSPDDAVDQYIGLVQEKFPNWRKDSLVVCERQTLVEPPTSESSLHTVEQSPSRTRISSICSFLSLFKSVNNKPEPPREDVRGRESEL